MRPKPNPWNINSMFSKEGKNVLENLTDILKAGGNSNAPGNAILINSNFINIQNYDGKTKNVNIQGRSQPRQKPISAPRQPINRKNLASPVKETLTSANRNSAHARIDNYLKMTKTSHSPQPKREKFSGLIDRILSKERSASNENLSKKQSQPYKFRHKSSSFLKPSLTLHKSSEEETHRSRERKRLDSLSKPSNPTPIPNPKPYFREGKSTEDRLKVGKMLQRTVMKTECTAKASTDRYKRQFPDKNSISKERKSVKTQSISNSNSSFLRKSFEGRVKTSVNVKESRGSRNNKELLTLLEKEHHSRKFNSASISLEGPLRTHNFPLLKSSVFGKWKGIAWALGLRDCRGKFV